MDSKTFFDNFETIADAPDGISRLRDLILDLAVRGKLVQQVVSDQPSTLDSCEGSFEIPTSWRWAPLSLVAGDLGQEVPKTKFHYIDVGSINSVIGCISDDVAILDSSKAPSRARKKVGLGTVLYSTVRPYLRNIAIIDREFQPKAIASTAFAVLHPNECIESKFLFVCVRSPYFTRFVESKQKGVAYPAINASDLKEALIPLPPFDEQKRIVTKVDELMALCDELETAQNQRNSIRTAARKSAIDAISTATTSEELDVAWKRISNNWMILADTPESIASLRSLIHDVALSGVFGGADTWREVPLGEISRINYGYTESANQKQVGPKFLRITDIQNGMVNWDEVPFCVISAEDEKKQKLESGDIVFARTGATTGKSHLLIDPPRSVCASYLIRLRPSKEKILPEYLYLYFQSGRYWLSVKAGMSGTAQGGFNSTKLGNMSVLVPALDEQQRIIAKVSELKALCDELDKSLLERNVLALKMAGAFVANLAA